MRVSNYWPWIILITGAISTIIGFYLFAGSRRQRLIMEEITPNEIRAAHRITSLRQLKRKKGLRTIQILDCGPRHGQKGMLIKEKSTNQLFFVRRVPETIKKSMWDHFKIGNNRLTAA
jgi:hypothetical protein